MQDVALPALLELDPVDALEGGVDRRVEVVGLFRLGSSFGVDGSIVTSDLNFLRLFPDRPPGLVDLGLIQLRAGTDRERVRERLLAALERDVEILTPEGFVAREVDYWGSTTPIGYVFGFGAIMGLIVGGVIVYQILFADVSEHLAEYATLKAFARDELGVDDLQAWDTAWASERLRKARFDISQEELRPYFPLPKVLGGLFAITPTVRPANRPSPVTMFGAHLACSSTPGSSSSAGSMIFTATVRPSTSRWPPGGRSSRPRTA